MTYQFKVGDAGKTTVGYSFRVIVADKLTVTGRPLGVLIRLDSKREVNVAYDPQGTNPHLSEYGDLLTPTKSVTKYINVTDWGKNFHCFDREKTPELMQPQTSIVVIALSPIPSQ